MEGLKPPILAKSKGSYLILSKKKKNQKELRKNEQRLIQQARTQVLAESEFIWYRVHLVQIMEKVILTVLYLLHLPTPDSFPIPTPTPFTASLPKTSPSILFPVVHQNPLSGKQLLVICILMSLNEGFPGGSSCKELSCQCRRLKRSKFNP